MLTLNALKNEKIATTQTAAAEITFINPLDIMNNMMRTPWPEGCYTVNLKEIEIEQTPFEQNGFKGFIPATIKLTFEGQNGMLHHKTHTYPNTTHKDGYAVAYSITMKALLENLEIPFNNLFTEQFKSQVENRIGKQINIIATSKIANDGKVYVDADYATKQQVLQRLSQTTVTDLAKL